jgi:hypothetical protein
MQNFRQFLILNFYLILADRAGLEPATSDLTGRHSNRLSYLSIKLGKLLNKQPEIPNHRSRIEMVGKRGLVICFDRQKTSMFIANKRQDF